MAGSSHCGGPVSELIDNGSETRKDMLKHLILKII
jgi:hypothetical protein